MSWNDGEVTIVPFSIKKPAGGGDYWQPSWKGQYKGEEFSITKPPKNHYAYGNGYSVRFKWKGRHPRNDNTEINPQIINQLKLKTMPQVKKLIRTFVDGMLEGKFTDAKTGKRLTFTNFDACTSCGVYEKDEESNINLHHRSMMFHHKLLEEGDKVPNYQCKRHTKYDALAKKIPQEQSLKILISDLKRGGRRETRAKMKLLEMGIDMDTIIPDYELIQMFNPRQEIFEKRRGMKKNAETFEANDMVKERYFDKQLKKYKGKLDWRYLSKNPSLTPALIEKYKDKLSWLNLSKNPALTPALIEKYKWNWSYLSQNPSLTPALIERYKDELSWYALSENPALTPALIEKYEDKLDWEGLSINPSLTPALIEKYIDKWDWHMLSRNPSFTPAFIEKYKGKLHWDWLSENPSLTPALIEKYIDKWDWDWLSRNPSLTPALIEKYKDELDWNYLSENPALTLALIEKYKDKLVWYELSLNPSLTPALIEKYEDKWEWILLSQNPALFGNLHVKKAEEGKKKRNPLFYGAIIVAIFSYIKS